MDQIYVPKVKLPEKSDNRLAEVKKANSLLTNNRNKDKERSTLDFTEEEIANIPIDLDVLLQDDTVEPITKEYLDVVLKNKKVPNKVKERVVEYVNNSLTSMDSVIGEHFRNTCIDMLDVLGTNKTNISFITYMQACMFVTYRLSGDSKHKAYTKTFPDRVMKLQQSGKDMGYLHSYAELYSKNKAVVEVHARAMLPTHIMYSDLFHRAMKVTAEIMINEKVSPKVRVDAANNILTHTKQPEIQQSEVSITVDSSNIIDQLTSVMNNVATKQKSLIENTDYTIVDAAKQVLIDIAKDEDEDEENIRYEVNEFGETVRISNLDKSKEEDC